MSSWGYHGMDRQITGTAPEPRVRVRIGHKQTASRGWEYESTVEIEYSGEGDDLDVTNFNRLQLLLIAAKQLGEEERDARNAAGRVSGS